MSEQTPTGCHCLCVQNHSDNMGICNGVQETALMFRHPLEDGQLEVPMCLPCATATLAARQDVEES